MSLTEDQTDLIVAILEMIGGLLVTFFGVRLFEQLGPGICFNCVCRILTSFLVLLGQLDPSCQFREITLITLIIAIVLAVISLFFDKLVIVLMLQFVGDFILNQFLHFSRIYLKLGIKLMVIVAILLLGVVFGFRLEFFSRSKKTAILCGVMGSIDVFMGAITLNKYIFKLRPPQAHIGFLAGSSILATLGSIIQIFFGVKHKNRYKRTKAIKTTT